MSDAETETHSGDLLVLHQPPPMRFLNEKACSSQRQQEQPDLQHA